MNVYKIYKILFISVPLFHVCFLLGSSEAQSKPYYSDYSPTRLLIHKMCTSHYLDLFITIVIGLNVITMSMEHYQQAKVERSGVHTLVNIPEENEVTRYVNAYNVAVCFMGVDNIC